FKQNLKKKLKVSECVTVSVAQKQQSTALFANVVLYCDYSTSANIQDVLLTWVYKSYCMDPVLDYYSTAYQASLKMGQDPSNDCPDSQRTIRTVIQKKGTQEPILGNDYRNRRITIQNKADLSITEVMWWDNGVYYCTVNAAGDTSGNPEQPVKLIVYHWLTVLFIILGGILLLMLFCICCCQCCPQKCCCYVRCPCCPQTCCCPEKAVMRHRMMKQAERAMSPWLGGQPIYAPMSQAPSQINPVLYAGQFITMVNHYPYQLTFFFSYSMPPANGVHTPANNNQMLDYLENQVRGMDMSSPLLQSQPPHTMQQMPPPAQHIPVNIPFSPGPPSMISALDGPTERRVITLPPIRQQGRVAPPAPKSRPPSSSESSRSGFSRRDDRGSAGRRYPSPTRSRGIPRSYSEESLGGRSRSRSQAGTNQKRSHSRDDLFDSRSRGNYSPPASRHPGSWSSEEEDYSRRRGGGAGGGGWSDRPSYTEYEPGQKPKRYSDKSSRSGTSVVI
uniref:Immunoglobulin-like domain containing receptor 1a n=1 Tax=Nothobranchius furzeri TaxID=105023 RepID=A0A8C6NK28_NOTFU